jgi:uncharacterized protein (TIGR02996 family)
VATARQLEQMIDAWRDNRAPELGDAIDAVSRELVARGEPPELERALVELLQPRLADVPARLRALATRPDDPRIARHLTDALVAPPFVSTSSQKIWIVMFELLGRHADPRTLARIAPLADSYHDRIGAKIMGPWMKRRVVAMVAALRERYPTPPKPTARQAKLVALAPKRPPPAPPKRKHGRAASIDAMYEAVYADPADDAARDVLADALLERNDPRGELVALQLARARGEASDAAREAELLAKHGKAWLGPLADVLVDPIFERGFLHSARVKGKPAIKLTSTAGNPSWATAHTLRFWFGAKGRTVVMHPVMRALRVVTCDQDVLEALCLDATARPLEELHCTHGPVLEVAGYDRAQNRFSAATIAALSDAPGLPHLRRLGVCFVGAYQDITSYRFFWKTPLAKRLEWMRFESFHISQLDEMLAELTAQAVTTGVELFPDRGWGAQVKVHEGELRIVARREAVDEPDELDPAELIRAIAALKTDRLTRFTLDAELAPGDRAALDKALARQTRLR